MHQGRIQVNNPFVHAFHDEVGKDRLAERAGPPFGTAVQETFFRSIRIAERMNIDGLIMVENGNRHPRYPCFCHYLPDMFLQVLHGNAGMIETADHPDATGGGGNAGRWSRGR